LNLNSISVDSGGQLRLDVEIREKVINGLRKDACPVYGVDSAKAMSCIEVCVAKKRLDDILPNVLFNRAACWHWEWATHLTVIERRCDSDIMHV
jgi:hypothetical protein